MRYLVIFLIVSFAAGSCWDGPSGNINGPSDSVKDTGNHSVSVIDTTKPVDTSGTTPVQYDCAVLKRKIPNDSNAKQIQRDLSEMIHCGVDSFDFLYVVPNLFPGWVSENHVSGNYKITYGDFLKHMEEFKSTDAYFQLHQRVVTLDSLKSIPFRANKLYTMKPTLGKLGFTEEDWEMFQGFASTYPIPKKGFTWGDMVDAFFKYKPDTN